MTQIFQKENPYLDKKLDITIVGFLLIAYGDLKNRRRLDLIGSSLDRKILKVLEYNPDDENYSAKWTHAMKEKIVNISVCDIDGSGINSIIVSTKKDSGDSYTNTIFKSQKSLRSFDSERMPMIICTNDSNYPSLLIQKKDGLVLECGFKNRKYNFKTDKKVVLAKNHTSCFCDVDGDLLPELVLVTELDGEKGIEIFKQSKTGFVSIQTKIPLKNVTGPIILADFNGNGLNDIAYITSYEDGADTKRHELKILFNMGNQEGKDPYSADRTGFSLSFSLNTMFPEYEPVFEDPRFAGIMKGIYVCDISWNSYPDVFILMKNTKNKSIGFKLLLNTGEVGPSLFIQPNLSKSAMSMQDVISISTCDFNVSGRQLIVVNSMQDENLTLVFLKNDICKDNFRITGTLLNPLVGKRSYGSALPGIAYYIKIRGNPKARTITQMSISSWMALDKPYFMLGLGRSNNMLNLLKVRSLSQKFYQNKFELLHPIVPGSDLIFRPEISGYSIELKLWINGPLKYILIVVVQVLVINLLIVVLLKQKEKRDYVGRSHRNAWFFADLSII